MQGLRGVAGQVSLVPLPSEVRLGNRSRRPARIHAAAACSRTIGFHLSSRQYQGGDGNLRQQRASPDIQAWFLYRDTRAMHWMSQPRSRSNSLTRRNSQRVWLGTVTYTEDDIMTHPTEASERVQRLESLIALRKMYRNIIRAERLLEQPSPVYQPQPAGQSAEADDGATGPEGTEVDDYTEQDRIEDAVAIVADMQLAAEQLKTGMRTLPKGFGLVFKPGGEAEAERVVKERVREYCKRLHERVAFELLQLPFPTPADAQAALNARNARYRNVVTASSDEKSLVRVGRVNVNPSQRLEAAEKVVEKFVARRIVPAAKRVRTVPPSRWWEGVKNGASYAQGLWARLNGGTARRAGYKYLPEGLPLPVSMREQRAEAMSTLAAELNSLEKKLQEASKAREKRLREAGIPKRARMAGELRDLDAGVAIISGQLAVRTLQLEMDTIYGALEEEALELVEDVPNEDLADFQLFRRGSSDEVALLAAEFSLLESELAALQAAVERGEVVLLEEEDLVRLGSEIPDMRSRLGIGDSDVFAPRGWSILRIRLAVAEAVGKVREGVGFFSRGVRLMGSDVSYCGSLFWRAARGVTLKPREVQMLRRTAQDLLTFIPFAIILIAPLTPVGHVLIFGFIQRYFPGFFPSQFSNRRQELMIRYEALSKQLSDAQQAAQAEVEDKELERAAAAVARLTAPMTTTAASLRIAASKPAEDSSNGKSAWGALSSGNDEGPASRALRSLEQKVAAAQEEAITSARDDDEEHSRAHG